LGGLGRAWKKENGRVHVSPARNEPMTGDARSEGTYVGPPKAIFAAILFCVVFAGVRAFHFVPPLAPLLWKSVPCEIMEFEMEDHSRADYPFTARVRYRFESDGKENESTRLGIRRWWYAPTPNPSISRSNTAEARGLSVTLPDGVAENSVLLRPQPKWGGIGFHWFRSLRRVDPVSSPSHTGLAREVDCALDLAGLLPVLRNDWNLSFGGALMACVEVLYSG
jgi:hypothetical protein